jgi:hypothetical protein
MSLALGAIERDDTRTKEAVMPLLDHFHPPVVTTHGWSSFHVRWAAALCDALNEQLPAPRYLAEIQVNTGTRIESDVAEFAIDAALGNGPAGGVAVQTYAPPAAARSIPIVFPDEIEVQVFDVRQGKVLVAVIELVSPANKDRPEHRRAFAAKSVAYLHRGIGLIVVDIVPERHGNLHHDLFELLQEDSTADLPRDCYLYAVAYRPAQRGESSQVDLWPVPLALGQNLPVLPLALRGAFFVPVELEATYMEARRRSHL